MFTKFAAVALAAAFLSAGAFAGNSVKGQSPSQLNVTVIAKNQAWPIKGMLTVEPCKLSRCIDI